MLVATAYQTAPLVALAAARRPAMKTAYFLQDYEGWFGGDPVEVVAQTYDLVPQMTAISTWLSDEIARRHGHRAAVVPMSGDPEVFYPRGDRSETGPVRVVAMLRYEERRGFRYLLPALAAVSAHPGVEIVLFGAHRLEEEKFPHAHVGVLSRDGVARLLSTAHIVVDPSLFQGFGLVGLEAMASGAACVLTDSGGVMEYARHDDNALVVPPGDEQALAAAILRLVEDRPLRERLARAGLATARGFTWQRSAEAFIAFLRSLPAPAAGIGAGARRARAALAGAESRSGRRSPRSQAELAAVRETLASIQKSTFWKAAEPYWRWKARLTGSAGDDADVEVEAVVVADRAEHRRVGLDAELLEVELGEGLGREGAVLLAPGRREAALERLAADRQAQDEVPGRRLPSTRSSRRTSARISGNFAPSS